MEIRSWTEILANDIKWYLHNWSVYVLVNKELQGLHIKGQIIMTTKTTNKNTINDSSFRFGSIQAIMAAKKPTSEILFSSVRQLT